MLNVNHADVYTDFNGLAKLKNEARKESPEALKETARQFEAIFLNNVLKSMREAKLADGVMDNDQSKFYNDMYDQQLAVQLSGSIGLADLIVKQLSDEKPTNEKLELEDYLNRSSSTPKSLSRHANAAPDKPLVRNHESQAHQVLDQLFDSPVKEVPETTLKNQQTLPIQSAQDFVRQLQPLAEQAARELGVEPRVILAQAALETGWGRSLIKHNNGNSSFNLFNIKADKAWQGRHAQVQTLEFEDGIAKKVNAGFRSYDSFQESFQDYVQFIKNNPRYQNALKQAGNAEHYVQSLQRAGYATDPNYADKVMSIYNSSTLNESGLSVAMNDQLHAGGS